MARLMSEVDLLMVPSLRDEMMVISNMTGQPSLTLRTGFVDVSQARSDWAPDSSHPLPRLRSAAPRALRRDPGRAAVRGGRDRPAPAWRWNAGSRSCRNVRQGI